MEYYISRVVEGEFSEVLERVAGFLREEGFGIKTEIDLDGTFNEKLGVAFKRYHILGACNPGIAFQAVQQEDKIGVFLPCNVILIEQEAGMVEVASVDVIQMMGPIGNKALMDIARSIDESLRRVMDKL